MSWFSWAAIRAAILKWLRSAALKAALVKLIQSQALGGFRAWAVKFIVTELYDHVAEPIVKLVLNEAKYNYDRVDGVIVVKRAERAQRDGDEDAYNNSMRDILN